MGPLLLLALLGPTAPERALSTASLTLVREAGAAGCPDEQALIAAVAARLGRDPFRPGDARRVEVRVRAEGGELLALIRLDEDGGAQRERRLSAPATACAELFESVALALSVAVDPLAFAAPQTRTASAATAPALPDPPVPEVSIAKPAPSPTASATTAVSHLHLWLTLHVAGNLGLEPGPAGGLSFGAQFGTPGLRIGVEARADFEGRLDLGGRRSVGGRVIALMLAPCLVRGAFAACALAGAGAFLGSGDTLENAERTTSAWAAAGARAALAFPLTERLELQLRADALLILVRTTLEVGREGVWTSPPLAGSAGLGVVWQLP